MKWVLLLAILFRGHIYICYYKIIFQKTIFYFYFCIVITFTVYILSISQEIIHEKPFIFKPNQISNVIRLNNVLNRCNHYKAIAYITTTKRIREYKRIKKKESHDKP